jgi:hypothetical protein
MLSCCPRVTAKDRKFHVYVYDISYRIRQEVIDFLKRKYSSHTNHLLDFTEDVAKHMLLLPYYLSISLFSFISFSTLSATLKASIPAGIPQYALFSSAQISPATAYFSSYLLLPQLKRMNLPSLQQRLSNLYLSASIPYRTPYMRPQLNPPSQCGQHNQIQETPCLQFQSRTCPNCAPGHLLSHISKA